MPDNIDAGDNVNRGRFFDSFDRDGTGPLNSQSPGDLWGTLLTPNLGSYSSGTQVNPRWMQAAAAQLQQRPRASLYNTALADQTRGAQQALYAQMQAQQAGPSMAAMQGRGALGANLQAALASRGGAAAARALGANAGQVNGAVGQAVLGEQMRGTTGLAGLASGLRGRDIQSAQNQGQAALQARSLDDANMRHYGALGSRAYDAIANQQLENEKLRKRMDLQGKADQSAFGKQFAEFAATLMRAGMGGG